MSVPVASLADSFINTAGFGGLCAVIAAVIAAGGVLLSVMQRNRTDRKEQWWDRFVWVVDHSTTDLGVTLTAGMLDQLTNSARRLDDPDLVGLAERYTRHVYAELAEPSPPVRHQARNGPEPKEVQMTAKAIDRFTFHDDGERETGRIMFARLLVRQAEFLEHDVEPEISADAARPLPGELRKTS